MNSEPDDGFPKRPRRRSYDPAFKRALVEQTLMPGASVARIAREHGVNANQLFKWRRQLLLAKQNGSASAGAGAPSAALVPVAVVGEEATTGAGPGEGEIEIRLGRAQIRIRGAADPATLQLIIASLRR